MTERPVILITRPEPGASDFAKQAAIAGFDPLVEPISTLEFLPVELGDVDNFQALLLTSVNGVRALSVRTENRSIPIFTVGSATARAAKAAGFSYVESADGTGADLSQMVARRLCPSSGSLLHVSGTEVGFDPATSLQSEGFSVKRATLYRVRPANTLRSSFKTALQSHSIAYATFFSPQSSKTFVKLLVKASLIGAVTRIVAVAISENAAEPLEALSWRETLIAENPTSASVLMAAVSHALNPRSEDGGDKIR